MKKGAALGKAVTIIIGAIVLILVATTIFPPMKKTASAYFEEEGLLDPKTEQEETAVIKGTEVSKIMIPMDPLPKDHDAQAARQSTAFVALASLAALHV